MAVKNSTKLVTGKTTLSYAHLITPVAPMGGGEEKYSVSVIIPKSDTVTLAKAEAAIKAAYELGIDRFKKNGRTKALKDIHNPLRDGDIDKDGEGPYKDSIFFNCSSKQKPNIVDINCDPIMDASEIYSGIKARVSVNFYAYAVNGSYGIAAGLNNVQKLADGTPLGGRSSAAEDFGDADDSFLD